MVDEEHDRMADVKELFNDMESDVEVKEIKKAKTEQKVKEPKAEKPKKEVKKDLEEPQNFELEEAVILKKADKEFKGTVVGLRVNLENKARQVQIQYEDGEICWEKATNASISKA